MSNNPSATLVRPVTIGLAFCLANHPKNDDLVCTRLDNHRGHCCDEIAGESWSDRGRPANCSCKHDHSVEKGLARR